ncbi:polyprenyl synthetase family protein [Pantoea rwandensis]|uniref:Geranylgeranyl pyrophosphate synthase n=1 Tax=Pantoea rwandensis TaxID=1076550 RepID=A0A1X1D0F2_9GAMM|nr:polyprenyl synthetase family protein [Pantoea rwandensis]ORM70153.1 geranylgeranyl pyrophosphate synthase [Pantoea rwandensis]
MTAHVDITANPESELNQLHQHLQAHLEQLLPAGQQTDHVRAAMRAGALTPGKRIRPLLLLLAARDMGCDALQHGVLNLACAVEMVHAASLILDDIPSMDNAQMRRGRPTIHRQFGENVAILAAIALLSRAFEVIAIAPDLPAWQKSEAIAELSSAVGLQGLVQGQFQDLHQGAQSRSPEAIAITNELKTSVLFRATLQMAAIAADATPQMRQKLSYFAQDLGQAFQLLDDLADGYKHTGKDTHQDLGKSTLVQMLGADGAERRLRDHLRSADAHLACACHRGIATRQYLHALFNQQLAMFH